MQTEKTVKQYHAQHTVIDAKIDQTLKAKLRKEQSEVVSDTTQLKLTASDGKKYNTDVITLML